jgi:hypothetical protein
MVRDDCCKIVVRAWGETGHMPSQVIVCGEAARRIGKSTPRRKHSSSSAKEAFEQLYGGEDDQDG